MVPPALSFPTGAPQAACQTLTPDATSHGATPQATDIPYVLNLSAFYDQVIGQMVYTADIVYQWHSQGWARLGLARPTVPMAHQTLLGC